MHAGVLMRERDGSAEIGRVVKEPVAVQRYGTSSTGTRYAVDLLVPVYTPCYESYSGIVFRNQDSAVPLAPRLPLRTSRELPAKTGGPLVARVAGRCACSRPVASARSVDTLVSSKWGSVDGFAVSVHSANDSKYYPPQSTVLRLH